MNIEQKLQATQYQKLKEAFTELGIPQVWKSGTKKAVMIESAMELLSKMDKEDILVVEDAIELIKEEKEFVAKAEIKKEKSDFEIAVAKIVDQKNLWTKESMEKRIKVYGNIFIQQRGTEKGAEAILKQEALMAAFALIFKK